MSVILAKQAFTIVRNVSLGVATVSTVVESINANKKLNKQNSDFKTKAMTEGTIIGKYALLTAMICGMPSTMKFLVKTTNTFSKFF